jgi:hypothetical protein
VPLAGAQRAWLTAQLLSGEAVPGELSVAHSPVPMALPRLVAAQVALMASVRVSLMAQEPSAPVMESLLPAAKLWAEWIRSFLAGATVPERLIAAPR